MTTEPEVGTREWREADPRDEDFDAWRLCPPVQEKVFLEPGTWIWAAYQYHLGKTVYRTSEPLYRYNRTRGVGNTYLFGLEIMVVATDWALVK